MFNKSEVLRPVERVTLKGPLNKQQQCRRTHTHTACLLMLSDAFCSLFPGMQNADETSQSLVHSLRRNCHSNPNICMNTKTHRVQWRMREEREEGRERRGGREGGRERIQKE